MSIDSFGYLMLMKAAVVINPLKLSRPTKDLSIYLFRCESQCGPIMMKIQTNADIMTGTTTKETFTNYGGK